MLRHLHSSPRGGFSSAVTTVWAAEHLVLGSAMLPQAPEWQCLMQHMISPSCSASTALQHGRACVYGAHSPCDVLDGLQQRAAVAAVALRLRGGEERHLQVAQPHPDGGRADGLPRRQQLRQRVPAMSSMGGSALDSGIALDLLLHLAWCFATISFCCTAPGASPPSAAAAAPAMCSESTQVAALHPSVCCVKCAVLPSADLAPSPCNLQSREIRILNQHRATVPRTSVLSQVGFRTAGHSGSRFPQSAV